MRLQNTYVMRELSRRESHAFWPAFKSEKCSSEMWVREFPVTLESVFMFVSCKHWSQVWMNFFLFIYFLVWLIYSVQKSWWQNHGYKQELGHKIQNSRHRRRKRVSTNWLTRNSQTIMSRIFRYHLLFKLSDPSSEGTCNQINTEWVPEQMSWWNMSLKTNRFSAAFPTKRQRLRLRNASRFLIIKICALEGFFILFPKNKF